LKFPKKYKIEAPTVHLTTQSPLLLSLFLFIQAPSHSFMYSGKLSLTYHPHSFLLSRITPHSSSFLTAQPNPFQLILTPYYSVAFLPAHPHSIPLSRIPSNSSLLLPTHPHSLLLSRIPLHSSSLLSTHPHSFHSSVLHSTHPHSFPLIFIPSRKHVPNSSLLIHTSAPLPRSLFPSFVNDPLLSFLT
jgi:hypothetical protein